MRRWLDNRERRASCEAANLGREDKEMTYELSYASGAIGVIRFRISGKTSFESKPKHFAYFLTSWLVGDAR
jgi:hypothetical protein